METQHGARNEYSSIESESDGEISNLKTAARKRKLVEMEDDSDLQSDAYISPQYDSLSKVNKFPKSIVFKANCCEQVEMKNKELEETIKNMLSQQKNMAETINNMKEKITKRKHSHSGGIKKKKLKNSSSKYKRISDKSSSDDSDSSNSSENPSSREPSVDRGLDFSKEKTEFNKIRVPTFTGDCNVDKYDYQGWKEKAVAYLGRVNASVEDKVVALKIAVSGNAGRVLQHAKITKVSQIFKTLKQAYEGFKTSDQLFHIKQQWPEESVMQLHSRIIAEAKNSHVSRTKKYFNQLLRKVLRNALYPEIQTKIADQHPRRLKDLIYLAHEVEQTIRQKMANTTSKSKKSEGTVASIEAAENSNKGLLNATVQGQIAALESNFKQLQNSFNRQHRQFDYKKNNKYINNKQQNGYDRKNNQQNFNKSGKQLRIKGQCYICKKFGHSFRDCRNSSPSQIQEMEHKLNRNNNLNLNAVVENPPKSQEKQ
jgi:hypothetical protein